MEKKEEAKLIMSELVKLMTELFDKLHLPIPDITPKKEDEDGRP